MSRVPFPGPIKSPRSPTSRKEFRVYTRQDEIVPYFYRVGSPVPLGSPTSRKQFREYTRLSEIVPYSFRVGSPVPWKPNVKETI